MNDDKEGWIEYRRMVLAHLDRLDDQLKDIGAKMEDLRVIDIAKIKQDVTLLKFQAALYGAVASAAMTALFGFLSRLIK